MLKIKDETHNRIYTFTYSKVLIDIEEKGLSIWSKESKTPPYIPNCVIQKLKTI